MRIKIETRDDFIQLVNKRATNAATHIGLVAKAHGYAGYTLTTEERAKLVDFLQSRVDAAITELNSEAVTEEISGPLS